MTVQELIEVLSVVEDKERVVVIADCNDQLASDYYSDVAFTWQGRCETPGWACVVGFEELTKELIEDGYDEDAVLETGQSAFIIHPAK